MTDLWRSNIINRDPRRISDEQYNLLVDVIYQLTLIPSYGYLRTLFSVPNSRLKVYLTNGVHYYQYDSNGNFHFNIQINNQPIQHVYVIPEALENPIIIDGDSSVRLRSVVRWRWQFSKITG